MDEKEEEEEEEEEVMSADGVSSRCFLVSSLAGYITTSFLRTELRVTQRTPLSHHDAH